MKAAELQGIRHNSTLKYSFITLLMHLLNRSKAKQLVQIIQIKKICLTSLNLLITVFGKGPKLAYLSQGSGECPYTHTIMYKYAG